MLEYSAKMKSTVNLLGMYPFEEIVFL